MTNLNLSPLITQAALANIPLVTVFPVMADEAELKDLKCVFVKDSIQSSFYFQLFTAAIGEQIGFRADCESSCTAECS